MLAHCGRSPAQQLSPDADRAIGGHEPGRVDWKRISSMTATIAVSGSTVAV
jgi:hypothetical protein